MNFRKYILPFLLITAALSSALVISSCDIKSPTEGIEVRLNTKTRETLVNTYFYDANTKNSISQNVKVTFSGSNASKITDETNDPKTVFTAENGILLFGIKDGTEFSESAPFSVTLKMEASGYETKTEVLKITSKGIQTYDMFLVNPATLPQNADQGTGTGSTNNTGTTTSNVQLTTGGGTTVNIPSGTQITTSTGTPLTGNISVNITTIPITAQNIYNVPQNLAVSTTQTIAPAISIDLSITDQNGNSSNNEIEISVPLADGIVNPRTGNEYQAGDTMGFFRFNATTGLWEKVGNGTVTGSLPKKSLRKINAGRYVGGAVVAGAVIIAGNDETNCSAVLTVANIPSGFNNSSLRFFNAEGNRMNPSNSGSNFYFEIPDGGTTIASIRINADLNDPFNTGTQLGSNIALACGSNSTSLNFPSNLVGAQFEIIGVCTSKDPVVEVFPNASFSYRQVGTQTWQSGSLVNGRATITGLVVGASYEVTTSYRGNTGNAQVKITSSSIIDILQISNPENLLSQEVDETTNPATVKLSIDIGNECD